MSEAPATELSYGGKQPNWHISYPHRDDHIFHPRFFDQSIVNRYLFNPTTVRSFISRCFNDYCLPKINASGGKIDESIRYFSSGFFDIGG